MKKYIVFVLMAIFAFSLVGCQETTHGLDIYTFPEAPKEIKCMVYSGGVEKETVINDVVMDWFYDLNLTPCEQPEDVEGAEAYSFVVDYETAFIYQDRGNNEAYVISNAQWYKVTNPSTPPLLIE